MPKSGQQMTNEQRERRDRLLMGMRNNGISKRKFQMQMEERRAPSSSRSNMERFWKGQEPQDVSFYVHAARIVGFTVDELLTGRRWPRTVEEAVSERDDEILEREMRTAALIRADLERKERLEKVFPGYHRVDHSHADICFGNLLDGAYRPWCSMWSESEPDAKKLELELARAVYAPLKELAIDPRQIALTELGNYVVGICQALWIAIGYYTAEPRKIYELSLFGLREEKVGTAKRKTKKRTTQRKALTKPRKSTPAKKR